MITTISLERKTVKRKVELKLHNKLFVFDDSIKYETYENQWYYGIIFIVEDGGDGLCHKHSKYDIVHHYHMDWERLIINNKEGVRDLPFHGGTYRFLPDGIKVIEL